MNRIYRKFFYLMIPMALKELISALVNLVDTLMIGRLGETAIAAVGIGNQVYFLFTVFLFGINCGAGVFASQFWGKQDKQGMQQILGLNLLLGFLLSSLFVVVAQCFPVPIYLAFRGSPEVIAEGSVYLRIVSVGYLATAVTTAFDMSVCCSEKAALPFLVRFIGLIVNVFFNWVMIFGHLGSPAMGVMGAAIATVIARVTEMVLMISIVYGGKMLQAAKPKELFQIPKELFLRFFQTSTPVILNEIAWSLGITLYSWVYARVSPDAMVIITIVQNIENLMFVFFHGSGNAAGVFIGKAVGAGKPEEAYLYGKKIISLTVITSLVISVLFILCRPLMLLPYQVSDGVRDQALQILLVIAFLMTLKALNFLLIVGIFRNGGDTKFSCLIDTCTLWILGVSVVMVAGLGFHLPLLLVYALRGLEEIAKFIISSYRFRSKKWIKNVVQKL